MNINVFSKENLLGAYLGETILFAKIYQEFETSDLSSSLQTKKKKKSKLNSQ